ncbi:MAG: hypothetical protein Q9202_006886 [Teloschistes flavicans]
MSRQQPSKDQESDIIRELRKKLRDAEIRAEDESIRAENERSQREAAEFLTRPCTFEELLEDCHEILFTTFGVETVPTSVTKGWTTDPKDKPCPTILRKWTDFSSRQQHAFDQFYQLLHPTNSPDAPPRLFLSKQVIQGLTRLQASVRISSEMDLRYWQNQAVEQIVTDIFTTLAKDPHFRESLDLGNGVHFDNQINTLNDNAEDVQARQDPVTPPRRGDRGPQPTYADMLCVRKMADGHMKLLFPSEYKPPFKVTKEMFRVGLREMNVIKEVVSRTTIPTDVKSKEYFEYHADKTVAATTAQTYKYMLEGGCEYGCLITGECIVFLRVLESDPNTLYYHLSEPLCQVRDPQGNFLHMRTAIAQMLSLIHMAAQTKNRGPVWCEAAIKNAAKWKVDIGQVLHEVPSSLRKSPPESPEYIPESLSPDLIARSPYLTRRYRLPPPKKAAQGSDNRPGLQFRRDDSDDSDDNGGPAGGHGKRGGPRSGGQAASTKQSSQRQGKGNQQKNWLEGASDQHRKRPYCSQKCLLGLIQASALDPACPHFESHRRGSSSHHQLSQQQLCTQIQQQLARNLDYNCTDLQIQGSRSMLFKVSLASHGYTFVGKGTRDVFVVDLKLEAQMYHRLHALQGIDIPVHLGSIDLTVPFRQIGGVRIIHMLLLAYGGVSLDRAGEIDDLYSRVREFKDKIALLGITHQDLELRNMLWNPELQCVLFIDFERSTLAKDTRALRELSPTRQLNQTVPREPTTELKSKPSWFEIYEDEDQPLVLPFPSPVKKTQAEVTPIGKGQWVEGDKENSLAVVRTELEDQEGREEL